MSYYSDAVIRDGAVAYWRLGETSGNTAYDSVGNNHGTISGGVTLNQAGPLAGDSNTAMSFNTTGVIAVPSFNIPLPSFSVEGWFLNNVVNSTGNAGKIVTSITGIAALVVNNQLDGLIFSYDGNTIISTGGRVDGSWHHIVFTYSGTTIQIYVDGVEATSGAQTFTGITGCQIGTQHTGRLDDVSIYSTVLTPAQVKTHHTLGLLKQFPVGSYADRVIRDGAVAYWRLGETSGTTAVDIIGGNNGTISGGVTLGQSGALVDGDKAMAFDGTTGKIVTAWSLTLPVTYTVEAWINRATAAGDLPIFANQSGNNTLYFATASADRVYAYIVGATPASAVSTGGLVTVNVWHHVIVVVTASETRFYVDGVPAGIVAQTKLASTSGIVDVGFDLASNTYFAGRLDDVAYYPTALTAPQVANHHAVSKYATPFGESIGAGLVMNLVAGKIYSLPPCLVHITASAPVEVSVDGVTFTALTQGVTGASYIRTLESSCSLVAKPVRPIAIGA